MQIQKALPLKKLVAAKARSETPEWKRLRDQAIHDIRTWVRNPAINRKVKPCAWFGYGKDGSALMILLKMAGVPFVSRTIDNGGDIIQHYDIYDEFDAWYGDCQRLFHQTVGTYAEILKELIDWGQLNQVRKKSNPNEVIDYWDMGSLEEILLWRVSGQFWDDYSLENDILVFQGHRGAEAMDRFYKFQKNGIFYRETSVEPKGDDPGMSYWCANPMGKWRDIDVWALLVSENAPVSPVYSMHDIPQKGGKQAFPRTYWYPEPQMMNTQYYLWLARYAPSQLKELTDWFPEIPARLKKGQGAKSVQPVN